MIRQAVNHRFGKRGSLVPAKQLLCYQREKKKWLRALQPELAIVLEESDHVALVKAKAAYTLSLLKA
jgi:hypothetical protein